MSVMGDDTQDLIKPIFSFSTPFRSLIETASLASFLVRPVRAALPTVMTTSPCWESHAAMGVSCKETLLLVGPLLSAGELRPFALVGAAL